MFTEENIEAIKKKKIAELECLGIDPRLYRSVAKWMARHYHCAVNGKYGLQIYTHDAVKKHGNQFIFHPLKWEPVLKELIKFWDLSKTEGYLIINEWKRDMRISIEMRKDVNKYWSLIQIPMIHEE